MGFKILRSSFFLPEQVVDNKFFESYLETSNQWIYERTGIRERRFAQEDTSDLVVGAVKKLDIENYKDKIDLILVSSFTPDLLMPNIASLIQGELNLKEDILAMDFNMACTGFLGGLYLGEKLLEEGRCAIVVGGEKISKYLDMEDRKTSILFGDGAGAVLIEKNLKDTTFIKGNIANLKDLHLSLNEGIISMNGQNVFKFATKTCIKIVEELLEKNDLEVEDIDHIISHQANMRILDYISKKLKIPMEKFHINLDKYGNTSSASIPILLGELERDGVIKRGEKVILMGFGAGLSYMGTLIEW